MMLASWVHGLLLAFWTHVTQWLDPCWLYGLLPPCPLVGFLAHSTTMAMLGFLATLALTGFTIKCRSLALTHFISTPPIDPHWLHHQYAAN